MKRSKKNLKSRIYPLFIFISLVCPTVFTMCAKVASPPGGPVDQTGAEIVASVPEIGAVNVPRGKTVQVTFSETVNKNSVQSAVFISPRPDGDLTYKWKGKTLSIILPDSFREATTYVVNIGANITDLRNNKMETSRQVAFSTGPEISRGAVGGFVADREKPAVGVTIGLFEKISFDSLPSFDSLFPSYMTQTGKDGRFRLDYLPDEHYFLLAYGDGNKNQTFDFGREPYGLSDRPIIIRGGEAFTELNVSIIKKDTTSYQILSSSANGDGLIRIRLTNGIVPADFEDMLGFVRLVSVGDSVATSYQPSAILESGENPVQNFNIYFGDVNPGKYIVRIDRKAFDIISDSIPYLEGPPVEIVSGPDVTRPEIVFCSHESQTYYAANNRIDLKFSEPIRFLDSTLIPFIILDRDTAGYEITVDSIDPIRYRLNARDLVEGQNYTLSINASDIADRSGNVMGQSIIDYRFATYDADSMGTVSGEISFDTSNVKKAPVYLQFDLYPSMKTFGFDSVGDNFLYALPPGKYQLRGYADRNQNGMQDWGSLDPPALPETWVIYPDTIRIRPRFETAGIELLFK